MTGFKKQCICIKLLFQIGNIVAETFQMLTFAFRETDCSILLFCRVQIWNNIFKDAEYSGCLCTSRMYRNVEHFYGIWHESRCITVHKLANELGSLLVYAVRF